MGFRTSVLRRLLLDLDSYDGVDPLGVFPIFFKMVADKVAPKLSVIFRRLIRSGSFPLCWRSANVAAVPKGPPSMEKENYRRISITPILSKVFEKLISHRLSGFCERSCSFRAAQFACRKGLGCTDALLTISQQLQQALDCGGNLISFISTSVQLLIELVMMASFSSLDLRVLASVCYPFAESS